MQGHYEPSYDPGPTSGLVFVGVLAVLLLLAVVLLTAWGRRMVWPATVAGLVIIGLLVAGTEPLSLRSLAVFFWSVALIAPLALGALVAWAGLRFFQRGTEQVVPVALCVGVLALAWWPITMAVVANTSRVIVGELPSVSMFNFGLTLMDPGMLAARFGGGILVAIALGLLIRRLLTDRHTDDPTPLFAVAAYCGLILGVGAGSLPIPLRIDFPYACAAAVLPSVAIVVAGRLHAQPSGDIARRGTPRAQ